MLPKNGIPVLFSDDELIACIKPAGVASELTPDGRDMVSLLREMTGGDIFPLHRLDRPVGGVMIFARSAASAAKYSELIRSGGVTKRYKAVVDGVPDPPSGEMRDFLFKDSRKNKVYVVKNKRRGVKEAVLTYETLGVKDGRAVVLITLMTGRSHQIRAQFSSRGWPVSGDGKYGSRVNRDIALWSYSISVGGKEFKAEPPWDD